MCNVISRVRLPGALLACALAAVLLPAPANAQAGGSTTHYACYVKNTGTVYRIRTPETPQQCRSGHVEFSWNEAGAVGPQGPAGPQGPVGPAGPAGSPGVRAYALAQPYDGLDVARTRGFTSMTRVYAGMYCLTPAPGISPDTHPAIVGMAEDLIASAHWDLEAVPAGICAPGQYGVKTYHPHSGGLQDAAFTIIVP